LEFFGESADVWFDKDTLVGTRHATNFDAAFGEFAPAKIVFQRAEQRLASGAEQQDFARVILINVFNQGLQVDPPEPQFVFGKMREIDDFFQVHTGRRLLATESAGQAAAKGAHFPAEETAAVARRKGSKIAEPVIEVPEESENPHRLPPGQFFVAYIGG
jgi:hypothetical protein